jgi:hypothetical protein
MNEIAPFFKSNEEYYKVRDTFISDCEPAFKELEQKQRKSSEALQNKVYY